VVVAAGPGQAPEKCRILVRTFEDKCERWINFRTSQDWRTLVGEAVVYSLDEAKLALPFLGKTKQRSITASPPDYVEEICREAYRCGFWPGVRAGWSVSYVMEGMVCHSEYGLPVESAQRKFKAGCKDIEEDHSPTEMGVLLINPAGDCQIVFGSGKRFRISLASCSSG
jgi:hypothetical protein